MRRIPVFATLIVLAAVALMVWLGFWQLARMHEKEALLAHYAAAAGDPQVIDWGAGGVSEAMLYRRARIHCTGVTARSSMAGRNRAGQPGVAQTALCRLPGGGRVSVVLGWSTRPDAAVRFDGGPMAGVIAPGPHRSWAAGLFGMKPPEAEGPRLIADPPVGGLAASALPDPADMPNNHFAYAVQWFLFAATALIIYVLALARRK